MIGVVTAATSGAGAATTATASPPPAVFLQVSSLASFTPATVRQWLQAFCSAAGEPPELVLQDVASAKGMLLTHYVDAIAPMLPGGSDACFSRVYVGTVDLQWHGAGTKYDDGVKDPAFRAKYLRLSLDAARGFRSRYPYVRNDWYLTYEANLNDLYYSRVAASYRSLLTRAIHGLSSLRPGRAMLWSPAFWYPYERYRSNAAGMAGLKAHLVDLFTATQRASGGRMHVALQDFVGGSSCEPPANRTTPRDAVGWIGFLHSLQLLENISLNVEQFTKTCATGAMKPADRSEVLARERYYRDAGVTIGPAFELRYWLRTHLSAAQVRTMGL